MKISIKNRSIFLIVYGFILITRLLSYVNDIQYSFYTPAMLVAMCFFIIMNLSIRNRVFRSKETRLIVLGFLVWILWGIFVGCFFAIDKIAVYDEIVEDIVFYGNTFLAARLVVRYNIKELFIKNCMVVIGGYLTWRYIVDFNGLQFINSVGSLMESDVSLRYRYSYGLYHANGTGSICVAYIVLFTLYANCFNRNKKRNYFPEIIACIVFAISVIMLLSTASRNSITSVLVFATAFFLLNNYARTGYQWKFIKLFLLAVMTAIVFWNIDIVDIAKNSNRLWNFTHNVPLLASMNSWWTGLGMVDAGYFGSSISVFDSIYVDNYYLYILLSSGIVGCLVVFVPIIYFVLSMFRKIGEKSRYSRCLCAMMVMSLYSALFETNLLYPMFITSMIYWILYIAESCECEVIKK